MTSKWKRVLLWQFRVDGNNKTYLRFHLKCPLILPDFNKFWNFLHRFS